MTISNLLYLASPIDRVAEAPDWNRSVLRHSRDVVHNKLVGYGFTVYRPDLAFACKTPVDAAIDSVNSFALANAAGVMVVWPDGIESTGIKHEIEFAEKRGIPVVQLYGRGCNDPIMLQNACERLCARVNLRAGQITVPEARAAAGMTAEPGELTRPLSEQRDFTGQGNDHLRWVKSDPNATLPTKAFRSDVGWDLYASHTTEIGPGAKVDVPFGLRVAPPYGYWCRIIGRSSTLRNRGLSVAEGVIDPGYNGNLFAMCYNVTAEPVVVTAGERVAQMILMPIHHAPSVELSHLPNTDRGFSGYGSSGT